MNNIIGLYRRRMMMSALGSGIDVAALSITYTGAHTDYGMVTMSDGARYRLLAFTSSGTLSIEQPVNCEVCVVGGGANGTKATDSQGGDGGAGAYLKNQFVSAYNGGPVVVGARQGVSSIADVSVNAVSGKSGGTGAGGKTGGTGDGISKYPFEDTGYSLWAKKPHCGGGGQGMTMTGSSGYDGGRGGTNGGNGYPQKEKPISYPFGGGGGKVAAAVPGTDYQAPAAQASALPTSGTALTANTLYNVSAAVGTYAFTAPATGWAHGTFTTGTAPNITFTGKIIGKLPTFAASKQYEFDVYNGAWIVQEVVTQ